MCFLPSSPSDSLLIFFGKCLPPCGLIGLADKGVGPATGLDQWDSLLGVWSLCRNSQGGEVGGAQQVPKRRIPEAPSSCSVLPETWLVNCFFFFSNSVSQELPVNSASLSVLQCPHPTTCTLETFRSGKVGRIVQ